MIVTPQVDNHWITRIQRKPDGKVKHLTNQENQAYDEGNEKEDSSTYMKMAVKRCDTIVCYTLVPGSWPLVLPCNDIRQVMKNGKL